MVDFFLFEAAQKAKRERIDKRQAQGKQISVSEEKLQFPVVATQQLRMKKMLRFICYYHQG